MWKPIALFPYAATVLTLAIIPHAQAAVVIPTPTVVQTSSVGDKLDTIDGGISALFVNNVVVETITGELSTIYKVCFEFGDYNDIFTTSSRPAICDNSPNGPFTTTPSSPTFLGNRVFAERSARGPSPTVMPTSNGLLTALTAALGGNPTTGVIRVQGDVIFDGINNGPLNLLEAYIPYAQDDNNFAAIKVAFNDISGQWQVDGVTNQIELPRDGDEETGEGFVAFARFQQTRTVDLNPTPPGPNVPEPSGVISIFLAGVSMFATVRRR